MCKLGVLGVAVLNRYLPRPKNKTGVNLLSTTQAEQVDARKADKEDAAKPAEYISFIKPYVSIALIDDATAYPANAVPDHVHSPPQSIPTPALPRHWLHPLSSTAALDPPLPYEYLTQFVSERCAEA